MRATLTGCLTLLMASTLLAAPPITDVARLFPPSMLMYAEIRQPREFARELQALIKGSVLEDNLEYADQIRKDANGSEYLAQLVRLTTYLSSESINELPRFHGLAIGVTGFNDHHQPEIALALLTGDSPLPGFMMRSYLTQSGNVHRVGQVENIRIYQEDSFADQPIEPGQELKAIEPEADTPTGMLTFAYAPGLVVIGSGVESVTGILKRWTEKQSDKSWADQPGLIANRGLSKRAGVYWQVDYRRLAAAVDARYGKQVRTLEPVTWEGAKRMLPPALVEQLSGSLTLDRGLCECEATLRVTDSSRSPVLDLLGGTALANASTQPSRLMMEFLLPADRRLERVLKVADELAKSTGELGALPSDRINESKHAAAMKSTLERIDAVALLQDNTGHWLVELRTDAATAEPLETQLPEWLSALLGEKLEPTIETIGKSKIYGYVGTVLSVDRPFYHGRREGVFCLGFDAKSVANHLEKLQVASEKRAASPASVELNWQWGKSMIPWLEADGENPDTTRQYKIERALALMLGKQPPVEMSLTHQKDEFTLRARQVDLVKTMPRLIDRYFEQLRTEHLKLLRNEDFMR